MGTYEPENPNDEEEDLNWDKEPFSNVNHVRGLQIGSKWVRDCWSNTFVVRVYGPTCIQANTLIG